MNDPVKHDLIVGNGQPICSDAPTDESHRAECGVKSSNCLDVLPPNTVSINDGNVPEGESNIPRRCCSSKWIVLTALGMGNMLAGACISLQAPFFPQEAEKKGVGPTEYGLVFGIFQLTMLIISPIYGKLVVIATPKFMINAGLFLVGSCCILFGFLDKSPNGSTFFILAMAVRVVEGLGTAAFSTASYTITTSVFTENVAATAFATLGTLYGIGLTIGPAIGGGLYDLGGYPLPFLLIGILLLLCAIITKCMLPNPDNVVEQKSGNMRKFWLNGSAILYSFTIALVFMATSFNSATLEPHLRKFDLDALIVGLVFVIPGCVFVILGPFIGRIIDKQPSARPFGLAGIFILFVAFLLIGPQPFFPIEVKLWLVIVAQVLIGFACTFALISSFGGSLKDTIKRGFPNDLSTYALVSSLYSTSNSLGAFIGPILGGFLLQNYGYRWGTTVLAGCQLILVISLLTYIVMEWYWKRKSNSETRPLLVT